MGEPQGLERLAAAIRAATHPILAIGGVDTERVAPLRAAGVHGVAVIRAILAAGDPTRASRALLAALG
jgi:thiamine-phosphate pyrophosphorylase